MSFWTAVRVIARRELSGYVYAPIAYIAGVLFLVLQGFSFWALVAVLSDPGQPAPLGAVLRQHFGGTFLYWTVLLAYVALLSMRLVAEEKRQGTWEVLCTAPAAIEAVLVGKWLAALLFYLSLWLPTLLFPLLIGLYAPAWPDFGPIVSAYLGVLLTGAAMLAIGLAVSAPTSNQLVAAVASFAALLGLFLCGQVPSLMPSWIEARSSLAAALAQVDVRGHMDTLARGELTVRALVFFSSLSALGLAGAQVTASWGRRGRSEMTRRGLSLLLVGVIAVCANVLASGAVTSWDLSSDRVNALEPRTLEILARLSELDAGDGASGAGDELAVTATEPVVTATVIVAGLDAFAEIQGEVDRLLARMQAHQPRLRVVRLDPALAPERADALAAELSLSLDTISQGGAVVFAHRGRRRAVDVLDMAEFDRDSLGVGGLARFRAEEAFASAIAEVLSPERPTICATTEHGELALGGGDLGSVSEDDAGVLGEAEGGVVARFHWRELGARIERDGMTLRAVGGVAAGVPQDCRVLVIAGPARPLEPSEVQAVARYLDAGGRLLLALSTRINTAVTPPRMPATGLEPVLGAYGVGLSQAVVIDPENPVDGATSWLTNTGYGEHLIVASFAPRRFTYWLTPRALFVDVVEGHARRAEVLVRSSERGYVSVDLAALVRGEVAPPEAGRGGVSAGALGERGTAADQRGAFAVAVAAIDEDSGARVVVFGSALSFSSALAERGGANTLLAAASVSWLAGQHRRVDVGSKTPERIRLIMSERQRLQVFVLCVLVMPGGLGLIGGLLWWRRRRG